MSRLVSAELQKVWRNHWFLFSLCILMLTNLFLLWFNTRSSVTTVSAHAYQKIEREIDGMTMQQMDTFLHEELARTEALFYIDNIFKGEALDGGIINMRAREQYAQELGKYYEIYKSGTFLVYNQSLSVEYSFLKTIISEFEQVAGYDSFLDSIGKKAKNLSEISIFAKSNDDYDEKNIAATAQAFEGMHSISVLYYPQKGLMAAIGFELTDVILMFAMLLVATVIIRIEHDNGLLLLIRSNPAGRVKTAVAKLVVYMVSLGIILFFLYGINLVYCGIQFNIGPIERSIQSVPDLMRSTLKLTVAQYLGFFLITKWLAAFICGVWIMLSMLVAKKMLTGILASMALICANIVVRVSIPAISHFNVLKYANLASLLNTNEILGRYHNLYWFGSPVPLVQVEVITAIFFGVLFLVLFCNRFDRHYFINFKRAVFIFSKKNNMKSTTPLKQEIYKFFILQGALLLILLFAGFQFYDAITTENHIGANEIYYRSYMKKLEGSISEKKISVLQNMKREFDPIQQLTNDFLNQKIDETQYRMKMKSFQSLEKKGEIFGIVLSKVSRLKERPHMQLVYETGWLQLFDYSDVGDIGDVLVAAVLCSICFSGLFAVEKQTGMVKVIGATALGREFTVKSKIKVATAACAIITFISVFPRFLIVFKEYGLGAWSAPLYSIEQYTTAPEIPLFIMAGIFIISRFFAIWVMAFTTLFLSNRIGNSFAAMFLSLFLFAFPPLLSLAGLTNAKWVSTYLLFHICGIMTGISVVFMGVLLIVAILAFQYIFYYDCLISFGRIQD